MMVAVKINITDLTNNNNKVSVELLLIWQGHNE